MRRRRVPYCAAALCSVATVSLLVAGPLRAQAAAAALTGTITGPADKPVAAAKISVKNEAGGQTTNSKSDPAGSYRIANLPPGDYEVTVSADGFDTKTVTVTLPPGASLSLNLTLVPALTAGSGNLAAAGTGKSAGAGVPR
jgi:hypothetical protein